MKHKLPYEIHVDKGSPEGDATGIYTMDESGNVEEIIIEQRLPDKWWLHPTFDFGLHYPMPYIWFGYWLITWEEVDNPWTDVFNFRHISIRYPNNWKYNIAVQGFSFIHVSISFMPD